MDGIGTLSRGSQRSASCHDAMKGCDKQVGRASSWGRRPAKSTIERRWMTLDNDARHLAHARALVDQPSTERDLLLPGQHCELDVT